MNKSHIRQIFLVPLVALLLLSTIPVSADDKDKDKNKSTARPASSKLDDKENPEKVGKRDINKHQINFYSVEKEIGIGQQLAGEVERQLKFVEDPVVTEYINRVGQNIVLNSDAKVPFTIKVVDSEEVNAFALPGGFFFVNKGLILAADNEAEVVGVMAHEIAHVAARHGTEQVSKGQLLQFGSIPLIFLGGVGGIAARSAANFALPLTFLKFSRGAETEADILGVQYTWASGYDPMAMVTFFEKLDSKEKKKPGTTAKLFSTHPTTGDRAQKVRQLISLFPQREEYILNTSDFNKIKSRLQAVASSRRSTLAGGPNGGDSGSRRPTLKRRRDDGNGGSGDIDADDQAPPEPRDRPTLKRRDGGQTDSQDDNTQDPPAADDNNNSSSPSPSNRPKLKRSGGGDQSDDNN
ncbi:MAG: M48 family metallopeptidase [Acidobacteriota bacterium]